MAKNDNFTQHEKMGNLDFPSMVAEGENPKGFIAQTANGTARDVGTGNNYQWQFEAMQAPETPTRGTAEMSFKGIVVKGGRANRSGE